MKKFLILFLHITLFFHCFASDKNKILSVSQMREDIDFYFASLQDIHPNPFIVLSHKEFKDKIDSLKNSITHPLSKKEFYLLLSSMNKYTDLHTRITPSEKMIKQRNSSFPLPSFSDIDNKIFFSHDNSPQYQLLSVNNISTQEIKDFFLSRRNLAEVNNIYNFNDELNYYKNHYFWDDSLVFKFLKDGNKTDSLTLYTSSVSEKGGKNKPKQKGDRVYHLIYDSTKSIAVFELNTFMPQKIKNILQFEKDIDGVFDTLKSKNIQNLYIDITCNGGGLIAFEEYLLNYLITGNKPVTLWHLTVKQSAQRRKQRYGIPSTQDGDYYVQKQTFTALNKKNKFRGNIFIIQSRASFSAASTLSS